MGLVWANKGQTITRGVGHVMPFGPLCRRLGGLLRAHKMQVLLVRAVGVVVLLGHAVCDRRRYINDGPNLTKPFYLSNLT